MQCKTKDGFTLIELSIVLVIIGLIVGGVIGGQALVKAAKYSSVISDIGEIRIAQNTFVMQYDALPGDMRDASDYWNVTLCPNGGGNTIPCNGNGDGSISVLNNVKGKLAEHQRAFLHLSLSEIFTTDYVGNDRISSVENVHYPVSKWSNGAAYAHAGLSSGGARFFNSLRIGFLPVEANRFGTSVLTPFEAKTFDKKNG